MISLTHVCLAGVLIACVSGFGGRMPGSFRQSTGIRNDSFAAIDDAVVDVLIGVGPIPRVHLQQLGVPRPTDPPPAPAPLPIKPKPAKGATTPQSYMPIYVTAGQDVSPIWGIPYRLSLLGVQVINQSFVLADQQANSTGKGFTITSVNNGVRFDTWYAATGANLPYPFNEIFLYPIGVAVSNDIQLASINPMWAIQNNDIMGYAEAIDYIGIVHNLFDEVDSIRKIADLGSWMKFPVAQTAAHQMFFPADQWNVDKHDAVKWMYRYIDMSGWATIDKYARKCFAHGKRSDYKPPGFTRIHVYTTEDDVPNSI